MITSSRKQLDYYVAPKIKNDLVYEAFKKVDRKLFVPKKWSNYAYRDDAIRLDGDSSISQPSLVAEMIDLLDLTGKEKVLEIGTGSGYSAAILSFCCRRVDTIEVNSNLARTARKKLKSLGFNNVTVHTGDGSLGLSSKAPFDAIVVTAAAKNIPSVLIEQLKTGGRIIIPVELKYTDMQKLILGTKEKDKLITKSISEVRFVPLIVGGE